MNRNFFLLFALVIIFFTSCEEEKEYKFKDGVYYAEEQDYSYSWKGFLEVEISNDEVISADFDYFNAYGVIKSETSDEDYPMAFHPRVWIPQYDSILMATDIKTFTELDGISGATQAQVLCDALFGIILDAAETGITDTLYLAW